MSRVLVFVPAYNCERQIGRALAQFSPDVRSRFHELIVVENRSSDGTVAAATTALRELNGLRRRLLQNDANYGLGGSHKVAFDYALDNGFDQCVVFHGDDQASIVDMIPEIDRDSLATHDCVLGSRFMPGARLIGYSGFRTLGNRVFNQLFSMVTARRLWDLGSGLNAYAVRCLQDRFYLGLADDLTFNYGLILASCRRNWRMRFVPIEWREQDQRSNVKMVRQSLTTLGILARYARDASAFVEAPDAGIRGRQYSWTCLYDSED